MRTLLYLNGNDGSQLGIEDGFSYQKNQGKIEQLNWFYFTEYEKKYGSKATLQQMLIIAKEFKPELIIFFHIGNLKIDSSFLKSVKNISTKPVLVYDEGDMYGTWSKPVNSRMKSIIAFSDIVSIRGLGKFYRNISKLNKNLIYTPHHNNIARYGDDSPIKKKRDNDLIFIGNKVSTRIPFGIRRLPGARGREMFVKKIGQEFNNFKLYGKGWENYNGNSGKVDFFKQNEYYKNTWLTLAYEHYPKVPYYFSNRLPMALMNGSLYVCHYHKGYEKMFPNCDFIFFFKTNNEAIDIINYLLSLSTEELLSRSRNAREFAYRQYHPNVIWGNFYNNILKTLSK